MWLRGVTWRDAGLRLPPRALHCTVIGIVAGIAMWLLEFFVTMPLLRRILGVWPDLSVFDELVGSVDLLMIYAVAPVPG